jgi:hypothetical protein
MIRVTSTRMCAVGATAFALLASAVPAYAVTPLPSTIGGVHGFTGLQGHSNINFTNSELRTIAHQSDIVVGLPVQIHRYWKTLRHYNRHVRFYIYQNGMFGQTKDCSSYPSSWKLHSASGASIVSKTNHNCLMNPDSGWAAHVLSECRAGLAFAGAGRGCFLDQMSGVGVSNFVSALPINPLTHRLFTVRDYLTAVARVGNEVARRMPVIANAYESGRKYYSSPTSMLNSSSIGGFEAEHWLGSTQPRDLETPSVWRASVNMLIGAQRRGKHVLANFDDLSSSLGQWQNFNVASMMLGNDGSVWLHFDSSNKSGPNSWQLDAPILHMRIGTPTETHRTVSGYFGGRNYLRRYTHGLVICNPSSHTYRLSLGGTYYTPGGSRVRSLVMGPYSGIVLRH